MEISNSASPIWRILPKHMIFAADTEKSPQV